jgi:predicted transcriptional regulator of viral defense system
VRFERCFADIWRHAPFRPAGGVEEFVKQFVENGQFDAEGFWEFVARQVNSSARKRISRPTRKPTMAAKAR